MFSMGRGKIYGLRLKYQIKESERRSYKVVLDWKMYRNKGMITKWTLEE
jgi:hypothetical protein